jgi:transcriptional regulator with XRE-family HTH domain
MLPAFQARVGRTVRRLRQVRGLSQLALAERAGVTREYIARLEGGAHDPTLGTLRKLATALGVTPGDLIA